MKTIAIVGASRGLGLGLVREFLSRDWRVIATERTPRAELAGLRKDAGDHLEVSRLDIRDAAERAVTARRFRDVAPDVLFVVSGVYGDDAAAAGLVKPDAFADVMITNAHAPMALIEAVADAIPASGAIVAMTSKMGSVAGNSSGGGETYRASKAALNTLLRSFAVRHQDRAVLAMHPGWVQTAMGGANAPLSVEDSARGLADVIEANLGRAGCRFLDYAGKAIDW